MTHTDYMAEAGPFTAAEARDEYLMRAAEGTPPTLEEMLRRLPKADHLPFTDWFVAHMETNGRTLTNVAEEVAWELETIDEATNFNRLAARLREAVRREREKTR